MPKTYTVRGFAVYDEIPDMSGGVVTVQESSNADGGVWLFFRGANGEEIESDPELSDEQAERVIAALIEHLRPVGGEDDGAARTVLVVSLEQAWSLMRCVETARSAWLQAMRTPEGATPYDYLHDVIADQLQGRQGIERDV